MIFSATDLLIRLKATLPSRWFGDSTSTLDSILMGFATAWVTMFQLLEYVRRQTRLRTASDSWLDLYARDFLGSKLQRRIGEPDDKFRSRVCQELFRERATRDSVAAAVSDLIGIQPVIFEPWHAGDTGGYGSAASLSTSCGLAYGEAGGWGNLCLPFQFFITIQRSSTLGAATLAGWNTSAGGFGTGAIQYGDSHALHENISDSEIYDRIHTVLPAAVIAWTRIID
jgi:hypothetical protein